MIDLGKINEAENILLDSIDYTNNNEVIEVALFYQYLSEKDNKFLENNNYTKEEVLSGDRKSTRLNSSHSSQSRMPSSA